jgi:hypothetical protein
VSTCTEATAVDRESWRTEVSHAHRRCRRCWRPLHSRAERSRQLEALDRVVRAGRVGSSVDPQAGSEHSSPLPFLKHASEGDTISCPHESELSRALITRQCEQRRADFRGATCTVCVRRTHLQLSSAVRLANPRTLHRAWPTGVLCTKPDLPTRGGRGQAVGSLRDPCPQHQTRRPHRPDTPRQVHCLCLRRLGG